MQETAGSTRYDNKCDERGWCLKKQEVSFSACTYISHNCIWQLVGCFFIPVGGIFKKNICTDFRWTFKSTTKERHFQTVSVKTHGFLKVMALLKHSNRKVKCSAADRRMMQCWVCVPWNGPSSETMCRVFLMNRALCCIVGANSCSAHARF